MTQIDPIVLLTEILTEAGHTNVHSDRIGADALASPEYIFLEEIGGQINHIGRSDRSTIQIVVYSNLGFADSRAKQYIIANQLRLAWGVPYTNGGIHRVINRLRPTRQDIPGLPYDVGRSVAQYDFIFTNSEKWV